MRVISDITWKERLRGININDYRLAMYGELSVLRNIKTLAVRHGRGQGDRYGNKTAREWAGYMRGQRCGHGSQAN